MKGLNFTYQFTLCNRMREHILCLDRLCEWLVSGVAVCLVVLFQLALSSCSSDDTADVPTPTDKEIVEIVRTVAVVAPIGDAATKSRLERTAQWFAENHREAQQGDSVVIRFQLEWYNEQSEDLTALSTQLAKRSDVVAVVGPFGNDAVDAFAPACMKMHKALIAPTATSEEVLRRYAVASRTDMFADNHFFWPLTEADVRFTETLMSLFFTWLGDEPEFFGIQPNAAIIAPADLFGKTFTDWAPFHATNLGIELTENRQYASDSELEEAVADYLASMEDKESPPITEESWASSCFCVVENVQQMLKVAKQRRKWMVEKQLVTWDTETPWDDPAHDDIWEQVEGFVRTWYGFHTLCEENLATLSSRDKAMVQGCQGFMPYADPATGFEKAYEERYGSKPTFAECKFYDALLLIASATTIYESHYGYDQSKPFDNDFFNTAIWYVAGENETSSPQSVWRASNMRSYLAAIREQKKLPCLFGASGLIMFDRANCTQIARTTYLHWQVMDGKINHVAYYAPDATTIVSPSVSWNMIYDEESAIKGFEQMAVDRDPGIQYPELSDQYAVLVQGSKGSLNYRHLADVLNFYQLLRKGGFDDDHIILIIDKQEAAANNNVVRISHFGKDLMGGTDGLPPAVVDYDNADLTAADIADILTAKTSDRLQTTLPAAQGDDRSGAPNVLFYWSGHGRSTTNGWSNEFAWLDTGSGNGFTELMMQNTAKTMLTTGLCRKLLVVAEPCYGEVVIKALDGITGVLGMSGANANEQSLADNWDPDSSRWLCDRFSKIFIECLSANPATTYRDLFLYCSENTLGSHACIVNAANFGNLYAINPQEFIIYNK